MAAEHLFAPIGLLANLFAVPVVTLLALPIGLCGLICSGIPIVSAFFFNCCGWLLSSLLGVAELFLGLPGAGGEYLYLSDGQHIAIFLLVVPFLLMPQFQKRLTLKITATSWIAALIIAVIPYSSPAEVTLYLFSVGQGESMLLTNNKRQAVLIDGGGLYSDRYDVGQRLLAPALGKLGIHKLDAVLLTHDHPDHRKGLVFVLREFKVGELWSAAAVTDLHPAIRQQLAERSIPARTVPEGWSQIAIWQGSKMSLYYSPDRKNKNNSSVVLHLLKGATGLLLTGDLEKEGVERLLRSELPGPVELLKLPHHGSKYSGAERLVRYCQPQGCLVSAGYENRYRFPAAQLVSRLEEQGLPFYRTDLMGTVRARLNGGEWDIDTWGKGLFH